MAMKDIAFASAAKIAGVKAFNAAAGTTAFEGNVIDVKGHNAVLFVMSAAYSATDAAEYTVAVKESDDNVTFTDVPASCLIGDTKLTGAENVGRLSYVGEHRYVKLIVTPSAAAASTNVITFTAHAVLQCPYVAPVK